MQDEQQRVMKVDQPRRPVLEREEKWFTISSNECWIGLTGRLAGKMYGTQRSLVCSRSKGLRLKVSFNLCPAEPSPDLFFPTNLPGTGRVSARVRYELTPSILSHPNRARMR